MINALEIKNLSKSYKKSNFHLDNVNLSIPKGSITGLVGKNGAGKSTIINLIFDISKRDTGEVLFYGETLNDKNKHLKNEIGVVFDTLSYSGEMNSDKLAKVLTGIYDNFDTDKFNKYLNKFDLPKDKKFKTFSRGMTMKLSIAVAFSHDAKLLILDEATAGLDPVIREEILDEFIDFISNGENAILMSSHISSDLERSADYITFIDNGKIILNEEKDNLIYNYGIAKMKESDFNSLEKSEYISFRKRGLQIEALVNDKNIFNRNHPDIIIDDAKIDEILPLLIKECD